MVREETYLGDGLYASFDGVQIRLRAPRDDMDDLCYLDPGMLQTLQQMVRDYDPTPADDGREWPQADNE